MSCPFTEPFVSVYSVKGYVANVDPSVFDTAFVIDNGYGDGYRLNGHRIESPQYQFFLKAYYKKNQHFELIAIDCILEGITIYFPPTADDNFLFTLKFKSNGKTTNDQTLKSRRQEFMIAIPLSKNDIMLIEVYQMNTTIPIIHDEVLLCLTFTADLV